MLLEVLGDASGFKLRAAAVIVERGRVLLHFASRTGIWMTPGGTGEFGETARETLVRELREELGVEAGVGPLLFVVEHFFTMSGRDWHQLLWLHAATLPPDCDAMRRDAWDAKQPEGVVTFRWVPIEELASIPLVPGFLAQALREPRATTRFIVHADGGSSLGP